MKVFITTVITDIFYDEMVLIFFINIRLIAKFHEERLLVAWFLNVAVDVKLRYKLLQKSWELSKPWRDRNYNITFKKTRNSIVLINL